MARKSTKHNTAVGCTYYLQDDTQRIQVKGVESCTGFDGIAWTTEEAFDLESGDAVTKKTVRSARTYTMVVNAHLDEENSGLAMAMAYAEEEGDKEQVYLIRKTDAGDESAARVCVTEYAGGDDNNALKKVTITMMGNGVAEVPEAPSAG